MSKHNFFTIFLSITLALCLIFSSAPVLALSASSQGNPLIAYAQEVLPQILEYHRITNPKTIVLGNSIPTYYLDNNTLRSAEYEAFPLFIDGTVYSIIRQYTAQNGTTSYSCRLDARNISNIDASTGAIVYTSDSVCVTSNFANISNNSGSITFKAPIKITQISTQNGTALDVPNVASLHSLSYTDEGTCSVPYISNTSTSCCPNGLCWAACCASLANKFAGKSYTALSFHNSVNCSLYHQSYHTYMIVFLNNAGVLTSSTQYTSNLTYSTLKNYVNNSQVALLHLDSRSSNVGHYVIGYGYYTTSSGTKHFRYMDPNEGYCTAQFPSSGTVYVVASGIAYAVECYVKCY